MIETVYQVRKVSVSSGRGYHRRVASGDEGSRTIRDEAIIKLNVRTFDEGVRKLVLAAIERIVNAEAEASGAPRKPEITPLDHYSLTTQ